MPDLSSIDTFRNRVLSIALLVAILGLWEAVVRVLGVPSFVLPPPSDVASGLWRGFSTGLYFKHIAVTVFEVLAGFALGCGLGFLLGVAVALNRYVAYFLYPYIVMFLSMPKVALAPLLVLWFGLGMTSKIVTAALVSFFPLMVNTITGLNSADRDRIDLIRSLGGSNRQIFTMLRLPSALPFIMAGLEIAITLSLIGTVVTEFLGAEMGLGMLMQSMNFVMDVAGSFSILIVLALVGLALNRTLLVVRRRVLFWERVGSADTSETGEIRATTAKRVTGAPRLAEPQGAVMP
jgi:NitT/TauT family transport system permease protein